MEKCVGAMYGWVRSATQNARGNNNGDCKDLGRNETTT